jgi:predicted dehydrogenase
VTDTIRWGIAATGHVAERFVVGLGQLADAEVVAVGSRSPDRAQAFGERHGIAHRHGTLDALAADAAVDAVYVASPHVRHEHDTLLFVRAGKAVLCEKPFALNRAQAERMVAAAREERSLLMEAMWSRFLPAYATLRDVLAEGTLGTPLVVEADFGFRRPLDPAHRLFDPALGGGALLDLGIYPLQLASLVLGPPDDVVARGHLGRTGVDEHVAAVLHHPSGGLAVIKAAVRVALSCGARVSGSRGWVELPPFMHAPDHLVVGTAAGAERIDCGWEGEGLRFQAEEVHRCLRAGVVESPLMPLDETLSLAGTLDAVRAQIGLVYPDE